MDRCVAREGVAMADRSEMARRPVRAPMPSRSRRRWAIAGGVAAVWIILLAVSRSIVGGTALLLLISAVAVSLKKKLRDLGLDPGHPWDQRGATPPRRGRGDGRPHGPRAPVQ